MANRGEYYDPQGLDSRFRICLANQDPNGNSTNGIFHTEHPLVLDRDYPFDPNLLWDVSKYLNVFIYDGDAGFASYPWDNFGFQGIYIGKERLQHPIGVVTFVHEIGHALGLYHTFEEGCRIAPCFEHADMVCDTPPDKISFSPCFTMDSCKFDDDPNDPYDTVWGTSTDMIENYMDGGVCQTRFTQGQVDRMHWALNEYKPNWDSKGELCSSCLPIEVEFESNMNYAGVGDQITFESALPNGAPSFKFNWFVDGEWKTNNSNLEISFNTPGVKIIRLSVSMSKGQCENIIWDTEHTFSVRCLEDNELSIALPERMVKDSCYNIEINGVSDLQWEFEGLVGTESEFMICPQEAGLNTMEISYGQEACFHSDNISYMVYPDDKRKREYFRQKMRFENDSTSSQDIIKMYEVGDEMYRVVGAENLKGNNSRLDTIYNFMRTWYPSENSGYEWELYSDILHPEGFEYPINSRLQLNFLDVVENTTDDSKYFLALEFYASNFNSSYVLGKMNTLGKVIWAKRLEMPDLFDYPGRGLGNKYIHIQDDELVLNIEHVLCRFDRDGNVFKAVSIEYLPKSLYDIRGLSSRLRDIVLKDGKIFMSQVSTLVDTTKLPIHTDSILLINVNGLNNLILSNDFELEMSSFYEMSIGSSIQRNSFLRRPYKEGSLLFWSERKCPGSCEITNNYHFVYMDNFNNIRDYKVLYDYENSADSHSPSNVKILENNDIILTKSVAGGRKTLFVRMNEEWDIMDKRLYELDEVSDYLFGSISNGTSRIRLGDDASILTQDGILTSAYLYATVFSPRFFYLFPLDGDLSGCSYTIPEMGLFNGVLNDHYLQPEVQVIPTIITTEDVALKTRKTIFDSEVICSTTVPLEDYRINAFSRECLFDETVEITIEICRNDTETESSIPFHLYKNSPFTISTSPNYSDEITISSGESCALKKIIFQDADYHFVLNAKPNYPTPYTLKQSFFDAAIDLEYNYLNNYALIEKCNPSVSTSDVKSIDILSIYPNPVKNLLNVSMENEKLEELYVYNSIGELIYSDLNHKGVYQVHTTNWIDGLYFLKGKLKEGIFVSGKFAKH